MKQKGLAPILIILFMALAVGGYLFYQKQFKSPVIPQSSPTPAASDVSPVPNGTGETANWKTYTSHVIGISFKYPTNAIVSEKTGDFPEGKKNTIHIKQEDLSIQIEPWAEGPLRGSRPEVIIIDNQPAVKYTIDSSPNNSGFISVDVWHGGPYKAFNLTLSSIVGTNGRSKILTKINIDLFNQILSTFKFTQ